MIKIKPVHPFPARMAPEIALQETMSLTSGCLVLDPMAGSGTVVRVAAENGHRGLGIDTDPLAVIMARVWTTPIDTVELLNIANQVAKRCEETMLEEVTLPWIDEDQETSDFVDYWFGKRQQADLRKLSSILRELHNPYRDALYIALSRIIVTKERGASLARDVSHSRPHRVRQENDYQVVPGFLRSVGTVAQRLEAQPPPGNVEVRLGDARQLHEIGTSAVDAIVTSPPYLNAIDYLRGHRLSLVWLGYRLSELRVIRSENIGSERAPDAGVDTSVADKLTRTMEQVDELPRRIGRMVDRYVLDTFAMISELHRVLRPGGKAVLVVGDSCLRGVFVENALAVSAAAEQAGFQLLARHERDLPPRQRYLPPPIATDQSSLNKRMRTETVLTYGRV